MRPPTDDIPAPPFPTKLPWVNVAMLKMELLKGSPVLVEFWDFCRVNSLRTLPYVQAWHERYREDGLRVIGVHSGGFPPSEDTDEVRAACARLGVEHPVVIDERWPIWNLYGNRGWPARYLWNQRRLPARLPLRRGRLRRDRAGDPGASRRRAGARRAACDPRTSRA